MPQTMARRNACSEPRQEITPVDPEPAGWREERARLLEMLAQQQRLAQAGLITAGLAHDIANHLMVTSGSVFMAVRQRDPAKWRGALERVQESCDTLQDTLQTFLSFLGRKEEACSIPFRLSRVVKQAERLLRPLTLKSGVALRSALSGDAKLIGDERMAVQALFNLGSNAIQACKGLNGTTVVFRLVCGDGAPCAIEVEDDGPGIPYSLRPQLFQPFTTGHAHAAGRGLGLFVVRQAIRNLGGNIRVETSNCGTLFRMEFPSATLHPVAAE